MFPSFYFKEESLCITNSFGKPSILFDVSKAFSLFMPGVIK
jgi:hypothetical protein